MSKSPNLTEGESHYLITIYREQKEESEKVSTTSIAGKFDVSPATVTETLQKLSKKKMLKYKPYKGVELTEQGLSEARKFLRKHRLLELLFSESFGYDPGESCEEASKIDHQTSQKLARSICRAFGHPNSCPCNKEIFTDPKCRNEERVVEDD